MKLEINLEKKSIWSFLENPALYRLSQRLLAPGSEASVIGEIKKILKPSTSTQRNLEVGCGPHSLLWQVPLYPYGLDLVHAYNVRFKSQGGQAITGSASTLPFRDGSFDNVWSFGLLHHLSDERAGQTIREVLRVVRPEGRIILFDGVLPRSAWRSPLIWLLRKLDRGRHMRRQDKLESLLYDRKRWQVRRFQYCFWGHEGVLCVYQKPAPNL